MAALLTLPVVDLDLFRNDSTTVAARAECIKVHHLSKLLLYATDTLSGCRCPDHVSGGSTVATSSEGGLADTVHWLFGTLA
jgi:hypothetical protein